MRRRETDFVLRCGEQTASVTAKTLGAAIHRFRRVYGILAGHGRIELDRKHYSRGQLSMMEWVMSPTAAKRFREIAASAPPPRPANMIRIKEWVEPVGAQ